MTAAAHLDRGKHLKPGTVHRLKAGVLRQSLDVLNDFGASLINQRDVIDFCADGERQEPSDHHADAG